MFNHETVLLKELVDALNLAVGDLAVDCTAGGGGHTSGLLDKVGPSGKVFSFDRDPAALNHLHMRFREEIASGRLILCQNKFSDILDVAEKHNINGKISGICADIGVSSPQLDLAERGFSFNRDGPLDMRMDTSQDKDASFVVNQYEEADLADIIYQYGEEPKSRFVARAIVQARTEAPITSTLRLADIVSKSIHYKTKSKKHPATKTFQALRIYVNNELGELESLCTNGFECLKPGGRLSIISFHSLEDKFVKQSFNTLAKGEKIPRQLNKMPLTEQQMSRIRNIRGRIIKPFPLIPSEEEQSSNPRSRSAKMRTVEKHGDVT